MGLAAIVAVVAAYLLREVLRQSQVPKSKRQIFNSFMVFCGLLLLVSVGTTVLESIFFKQDRRMAKIRELLGRLDENEVHKYEQAMQNASPEIMKMTIKKMCEGIVEIGTQADAETPHCRAAMQ
jgi:Na+/phosphate symporter